MISSQAWNEGIRNKSDNIVNGFKATGIWPCSFPKIQQRLKLYRDGGIKNCKKVEIETKKSEHRFYLYHHQLIKPENDVKL